LTQSRWQGTVGDRWLHAPLVLCIKALPPFYGSTFKSILRWRLGHYRVTFHEVKMISLSSAVAKQRHPLPYYLTALFIIAALLLSIFSLMHLCTGACEAEKNYRLFNLPFEFVGIPFFIALLALHCFGWSHGGLTRLKENGIAAALGAELVFIAVQKFRVGSWCPLCLTIAAAIAAAAIALFWERQLKRSEEKKLVTFQEEQSMNKRPFSLFASALAGLIFAFVGIGQQNAMEAAEKSVEEKLVFGNKDSPIEVYIFTDWFCPPCHKIEPILEKMLPQLKRQASVIFVDMPVHPDSMNFIPYNMSFMVYNKLQYPQLRNAIVSLSQQTKKPTEEEVAKAAEEIGVTFKELPFSEIALGVDYFQELAKRFHIEATPTLVLVNRTSKEQRTLEGINGITEKNILNGIEELKGETP